ncbi:MAG: IS3 family transposase [Clostridia bacterium]|nr:IS3 family transposase [Clostridia bacterium]
MSVSRSGFYKWRKNMNNPSEKQKQRAANIALFSEYHNKYPTHGYRWLNAKIKLDTGLIMSDNYAQRCCFFAGIRSISKRCRFKKPGEKNKLFPNLLMADLAVNRPFEVVASDMTAFWCQNQYYELTLYMDLWNERLIAFDATTTRGCSKPYITGLEQLAKKKKEYTGLKTILHTDQGSVYSSKAFNEVLPLYNITHSMSRAGTPTDNGAMEAINGWLKEELFNDFKIKEDDNPIDCIKRYIKFFNEERPCYSLNYLTPKQFTEINGYKWEED